MVAQVWNPNAPDQLGIEWRPVLPSTVSYVSGGQGLRLRSRSAETIDKLRWAIRGSSTRDRHMMAVDIYEHGSEKPDNAVGDTSSSVRSIEYSPNADLTVESWRRIDNGTQTDLWSRINENPVAYPPSQPNWGIETKKGSRDVYRCRVASGAFPLTARVLRLAVRWVNGAGGFEWRDTELRLHWAGTGSTSYPIPGGVVSTHYYGKLQEVTLGEINPRTLRPWTPDDVRAFSTAGGWALRFDGIGNTASSARLMNISLRVYYQEVENRKAVALWRRPATDLSVGRGVESDTITTMPGGTSNWAKASGKDYTFIHRVAQDVLVQGKAARSSDVLIESQIDPTPSLRTPRFAAEKNYSDVPVPGMASAAVTVDKYGRARAFNGFTDPALGFSPVHIPNLMMISSGVVSEDSQPYAASQWLISWQNGCHVGKDGFQQMTPPSSGTYLGVDFVAAPPDKSTAPLVVQVKTTGGTNVGGSFSISASVARALPNLFAGMRRINGWFSSAASLTGGTAYRVTFTSSAPSSDPWKLGTVGAPDSIYTSQGVTAPAGGRATFQGTGSLGTFDGTTDQAVDLMVVLLKQPTLPTGATAAVTTVTMDTPASYCKLYCFAEAIEVVDFSWTASTYTGFAWWEIEREEADLPDLWVRIARINTQAQKSYRDWVARRGIGVRYRARAVLTNGSWTDWRTSNVVTPQAKEAEVIFTSDALPSLTVAYDREPEVTYRFLGTEEDTFVTMAGADYQRVFLTPHERGKRFSYQVIVNMITEPDADRKGAAAFLPLLQIARSPEIPYVVVLDHEGQRFYAHVQIEEGVNEQPEHVYTAVVTVTEVAGSPTVVVVD